MYATISVGSRGVYSLTKGIGMRKAAALSANDVGNDRVLRETRWLSVIIVPFLLAAFGILYLFPDSTQELFAWNIKPRMTSMMLGAAYLGGVYFFVRAALATRWHWIQVGFLPITLFAALMGIATLLHWDRFNHGHISFLTWAVLYFTTPFLVLAVWLRNRNMDPGTGDNDDVLVPPAIRWGIGGLGVMTFLIAVLLFLQPDIMSSLWPWKLTPLTARVLGGLFALTGAEEVSIALDARWSAARVTLQSQLIALAAIDLAIVFSWGDFNHANPLTWVFVGGLIFLFVALALLTAWFEIWRLKRRREVTG